MTDFADRLASLAAKEAADAKGDPDRMGVMIERLAAALGFTVAVACRGNAEAIDEMMVGAEAHAHSEAVHKARVLRLMNLPRRTR